ncbi:MAG: hypothetical protein J0L92_36140, partial [Deltaproteobacteria bacterium]|nr:hypothetical protein [Deltaproteobacteria bacterium]
MTLSCDEVRDRLADGVSGDAGIEAHVHGCASCRALATALGEVDGALRSVLPIDAPEVLVEATLARVAREDVRRAEAENAQETGRSEAPVAHESRGVEVEGGSIVTASLAVIVAALGAVFMAPLVLVRAIGGWLGRLREARSARVVAEGTPQKGRRRGPWIELALVAGIAGVVGTASWQRFGNMVKGKIDGSTNTLDAMPTEETEGGYRGRSAGGLGWFEDGDGVADSRNAQEGRLENAVSNEPADEGRFAAPSAAMFAPEAEELRRGVGLDQSDLETDAEGERSQASGHRTPPAGVETIVVRETADETGVEIHNGRDDDRREVPQNGLALAQPLSTGESNVDVDETTMLPFATTTAAPESVFWQRAQATEGLALRARDGWWQSTYVPGDPAIRLLQARLASSSVVLPAIDRTGLAFAEDVRPIEPMLDAPRDRALAVGAFADTASIDGSTRVRVEVALRSIAQASGRRGALRIAVVLDADAPLDAQAQSRIRAIVNALTRTSSARDQLALYASGAHGGRLAALGSMRTGRLELALRHLFAGEAGAGAASGEVGPVSMSRAVTDALESVSGADAVGLVLVLTPDSANDRETERAIHLGTLAGITTTAVGVGEGATLTGLDAIALAGQGRRRIVLSEDDATAMVRAELSAASELVARAVRVRVRLAEGVDLVDVIGSRPLDAQESARTREVEQSIDRDLAQRLGILSDREDDDDGIRMLLPAFYANDAHTLVLDLIVRRPGRVLDVDVSLKDLVRVGNARASASLTLPGGRAERGSRELRVVADTLAHESAR